jgi:two-component system cell cycle sensor histidine kinase/response regulator CckA
LDDLREEALVRMTGICQSTWEQQEMLPKPSSFCILLRAPEDIQIIRKAPWWTLGRAMGVIGTLLGVLLMSAGLVLILRHQVNARTAQLRQQMRQRETLEEQLRQSQKLESIGRLAGGMAHDFNNLLTVINGYSDLLLSDLENQKEPLASVEEIKRAGEKASTLIRQLLAFSRKQVLQPVVLDLNGLLLELQKMLQRLIGEDIELVMIPSSKPAHIQVDPTQFSQVLVNLAANARDAMPRGGRLVMEVDRVELDAGYVESHPEVIPGEHVRLTVSDSGIGMDEETRSHIFEPFFTTKERGKGTGLGLATVFGIINQSGGHIWVYSEPGQGTCFKIYIPQATTSEEPRKESATPSTIGGSETILVVEDQIEVSQFIQKTLAQQGYQVFAAANAEEALEKAEHHAGPIHLLLTDVVLPGINGRALADRILMMRPGIRVLYMSGYAENVVVHRGILDAGVQYLPKPFSPSLLNQKVREILGSQRT